MPAQFTPDSRELVFATSVQLADSGGILFSDGKPRMERWNLGDRARVASEVLPAPTCGSFALSSDGRTLACNDMEGNLRIVDTASREIVLEKTKVVRLTWILEDAKIGRADLTPESAQVGNLAEATLEFSPDGRFFVARPAGMNSGSAVMWDMRERHVLKPAGALKALNALGTDFAFISSDRILIWNSLKWRKGYTLSARVVSFPDGNLLSTVKVPWGEDTHAAADSQFLIVRHPFHQQFVNFWPGRIRVRTPAEGTVALELSTGQAIISGAPALDVFGSYYVAELKNGDVGIYERGKGLQVSASLQPN